METKISLLELRSLAVITVTIPSPPPLMSGQHIFRSFFILCLARGIFSGPPPFFFTSFSILRPFTLFFRIPCIPHGPPDLPHLQPLYPLEYLAPPFSYVCVYNWIINLREDEHNIHNFQFTRTVCCLVGFLFCKFNPCVLYSVHNCF